MLYFGYGSNLDVHNWAEWCENRGFDPASIEPVGPAWLPDYEPIFHYQSRLRKGGALDVRPRRGTAAPGALFRVHDWKGLDAKEGVSGSYYRRIPVTALTDDGRSHDAITYTVCEDRVRDFVAPGPEYRDVVIRGLRRFGHSTTQFEAVATGAAPPSTLGTLFVYGTLMTGQRTHDLVSGYLESVEGPARFHGGALVKVDWYPGLILDDSGVVHGEVFDLRDPEQALRVLDPYEDFLGYGRDDSLYRRSVVRVLTGGASRLAWAYVYTGDTRSLPLIPSGDWTKP
ncbi:MAG: gamma-glutamylcyclotransferase [Myxococcota bacterium]